MFLLSFFILLAITVLLCALPTGYLFMAISTDQDPRTAGSGNIGMTNVWRLQGSTLGMATLLADLGKGYLCLLWAFTTLGPDPWPLGLLAGAAILSHCYSIYLDFAGGKGVAVAGGVFLAISPSLFTSLLVLWAAATLITRKPSLGSLACSVMIVPLVLYLDPQWIWLTIFAAILVGYRHLPNMQAILAPSKDNDRL